MFAYCRNNPIVLEDVTGTADRTCIYAEGRIDDEPWRDHSPGGGGIPRRNYSSGSNYYGEAADKFYIVKFFRAVGEVWGDVDWDEVGKKTLLSTIEGAVAGATTGLLSGALGAPFTAGASLPACAVIGGLIGGVGGLVGGFVTALIEEFIN